VYSVDGAKVMTYPPKPAANLWPVISDYTVGGDAVSANWLQMSPYAASHLLLEFLMLARQSIGQLFPGAAICLLGQAWHLLSEPKILLSRTPVGLLLLRIRDLAPVLAALRVT
jgi:hypothetical protein